MFVSELKKICGGRVFLNVPLRGCTTFHVGGTADIVVEPSGEGELGRIISLCAKEGRKYFVLGNGSNLIAGDGGVRVLVIRMGAEMSEITVDGDRITAQAGAKLSKVARAAAEASLSGLEFAAGIPGTVGGALIMNAGAYGGEMKDVVIGARYLDKNAQAFTVSSADLGFSYRRCSLPAASVVTEVTCRLHKGDRAEILEKINEFNARRREKQPLDLPSAGSVFKRPEGHFAGALIEAAGLKGARIGGAMVSEKHAGFIVNAGGATCADIERLIARVVREVEDKSGVTLEREVRILGEEGLI